MEIIKTELNDEILNELIDLSSIWEDEDITYGYKKNSKEDIIDNNIYLCIDNKKIIGYAFGKFTHRENFDTIFNKEELIFEISEIYVLPNFRNKGIGKEIFKYIENDVKNKTNYIFIATSTKNYKAILHFYIDEVGMDFHSACLFKKINYKF